MKSMKTIKRRIASVSSTHKIMKAMDLVAASKLQKAKAQLETALLLFNESKRIIDSLKNLEIVQDNIFVEKCEVKNTAYVVITSDRGLCGGYNINIAKKVLPLINSSGNEKIFTVGLKGWEYFSRRRKNITKLYTGVSETAFYEDAEAIGMTLSSLYTSGEIDEIYVAYTKFESMTSHVPCVEKVFPISCQGVLTPDSEMKYEPDANTFLMYSSPMYLCVFLYNAMAQSAACEQAARMVSMDAAANNAAEIMEDLSHKYNRIRQDAITQEINEIVSGANIHK